jgi:hypothetical protein
MHISTKFHKYWTSSLRYMNFSTRKTESENSLHEIGLHCISKISLVLKMSRRISQYEKHQLEGVWNQLEYSVNFSLDLMLIMYMSVLCVLLYAQIEGEFRLYLVELMVSFKLWCESHSLEKRRHQKRMDGSQGIFGCSKDYSKMSWSL